MVIGTISPAQSSGFAPRVFAGDGVSLRARHLSQDAKGGQTGGTGSSGNASSAPVKDVHDTASTQQASAAAARNGAQIKFKDTEGTRVMEVFDNKNVLIYQVPPKGVLTLIHSLDKQSQAQFETIA